MSIDTEHETSAVDQFVTRMHRLYTVPPECVEIDPGVAACVASNLDTAHRDAWASGPRANHLHTLRAALLLRAAYLASITVDDGPDGTAEETAYGDQMTKTAHHLRAIVRTLELEFADKL